MNPRLPHILQQDLSNAAAQCEDYDPDVDLTGSNSLHLTRESSDPASATNVDTIMVTSASDESLYAHVDSHQAHNEREQLNPNGDSEPMPAEVLDLRQSLSLGHRLQLAAQRIKSTPMCLALYVFLILLSTFVLLWVREYAWHTRPFSLRVALHAHCSRAMSYEISIKSRCAHRNCLEGKNETCF